MKSFNSVVLFVARNRQKIPRRRYRFPEIFPMGERRGGKDPRRRCEKIKGKSRNEEIDMNGYGRYNGPRDKRILHASEIMMRSYVV